MTPEIEESLKLNFHASDFQKIGVGGFAEVYSARIGPVPCAIKVSLLPLDQAQQDAADEEFRLMANPLVRECDAILRIFGQASKSGYLMTIWELGEKSLEKRLRECVEQGLRGIPTRELEGYLRDVAHGIDCINDIGYRHRDIKPENIILMRKKARVADFGLAVFTGASVISKTQAGTTGYLPLEAYGTGENRHGQLHPTLDIYSLAATSIRLATGNLPFGRSIPEVIENQKSGSPNTDGLTAGQKEAVTKALHPDPEKRPYQTATAFVEAFFAPPPFVGEYNVSPYPEELTHPSGIKLKLIMPGEFMMGASSEAVEAERERYRARIQMKPETVWLKTGQTLDDCVDEYIDSVFANVLPQHRVRISMPFYCGVFPVTFAQWEHVTRRKHWIRLSQYVPPNEIGNDFMINTDEDISAFPVYDANPRHFLALANALPDAWKYGALMLPTEAEWEYCARAGTTSDVCEGYLPTPNSDNVGQGVPNAWGLFDFGLVPEYCRDNYAPSIYTHRRHVTTDPSHVMTLPVRCEYGSGDMWLETQPEVVRGAQTNAPVSVLFKRFTYDRFLEWTCGYPDRLYRIGFRVVLPLDGLTASGSILRKGIFDPNWR